ncbi:MAG: D-2-hydroxyacid dehydrogenase [Desulfobacterales bacterium]|nr:D-2-hydroxyacid dehydrogenase [Desulfobacterales bacterium]
MLKFVMLDRREYWAERLQASLADTYQIVTPENEAEAQLKIADADAAYGWVSPEMLPLAQKLRWLHSPRIGADAGYYYKELTEHPVVVTNPRGTFNDHIGQHIMMYVLALARGLFFYMEAQRQQKWDKNARKTPYIDLATSTAMIVGVGGIGQQAAGYCTAFGMKVVGIDARWEYDIPDVEKHPPEDLDSLLPEADFVIVTVPHTPETEGMWTTERFQLMKRTAYFINIGRGMTTKLDDLVEALINGTIAGCGLDVFEIEPLPSDHKLWKLPNVILTPHVAFKDATNISERQFEMLLDNMRRFAAGEELRNIVDKSVWY